jgi:hypothetical protein
MMLRSASLRRAYGVIMANFIRECQHQVAIKIRDARRGRLSAVGIASPNGRGDRRSEDA